MALREFGSVKVGDQLPEKIIPLTRGDLVNYAGVSGDLNPIHWDDEIAKQVGLDTAIAHGMLTMGLGGGYVTSWIGDPAAVTEYNVRFTAVVPVPNDGKGAEIVFNGRVKSVDPETKSVVIALSPRRAERRSSAAPSPPRRSPRSMALKTDIRGMVYQYPDTYVVGREQIRQYAKAVKALDPARIDEDAAAELGHSSIIAPPTFMAIFAVMIQTHFFQNVDVGMETLQIVQVDQKFLFHQPIKAGDELTGTMYVQSVDERFGADIVTTRNVCRRGRTARS